jgi:hypothetical protein
MTYTEKVLDEPVVLYRVYGGNAKKLKPRWTPDKPRSRAQAREDLAVLPEWNKMTRMVTIEVPKWTTIYEGFAAPQGPYPGGGRQVFIFPEKVDPLWVTKDTRFPKWWEALEPIALSGLSNALGMISERRAGGNGP